MSRSEKIDGGGGNGQISVGRRLLDKLPSFSTVVDFVRVTMHILFAYAVIDLSAKIDELRTHSKEVMVVHELRMERQRRVMTALDCIERLGDELNMIPQSLLLATGDLDFEHAKRVRSCVSADVMAEIADITWDIETAGHTLDGIGAKIKRGIDRRLDRIFPMDEPSR